MSRSMSEKKSDFGGENADSRSWGQAMRRGFARRCPRCGHGSLFAGYTRIAPSCTACGLDFSGHEADDAPPYATIMIVGHILIPAALAVEEAFDPPLWLQFAIWSPLILAASLTLLPLAKGALIGLQWANRMHGFVGGGGHPVPSPEGRV